MRKQPQDHPASILQDHPARSSCKVKLALVFLSVWFCCLFVCFHENRSLLKRGGIGIDHNSDVRSQSVFPKSLPLFVLPVLTIRTVLEMIVLAAWLTYSGPGDILGPDVKSLYCPHHLSRGVTPRTGRQNSGGDNRL